MAKIYVSLEFDGGDLSFQRELKSWTGTDRQAAFTLVLQALNVYLETFTPEMRHAWDDLVQIRHLFLLHAEELPVSGIEETQAAEESWMPRRFSARLHPSEPTDVTVVQDDDGDIWHRNDDGLWYHPGMPEYNWMYLLRRHGSLTEVRKDT